MMQPQRPLRRLPQHPIAARVLVCLWTGLVALVVGVGSASAQGFQSVYTKDGTDIWAVGDQGAVWRSFDTGASWSNMPSLGARTLRGVAARGLVALAVGDSGRVFRSTNNGGAWVLTTLTGAPHLRGVEFPTTTNAFVCGDGGTIQTSGNGGLTWSPQVSGTVARLNAIRFRDASNGWAVGQGGVILQTVNGGANWGPIASPTTNDLFSVDFIGSTVWVVGAFSTAYKSTNSGGVWSPVNLRIDSKGDVRAVWLESATQVSLTGGGGFLRTSLDGGTTWTFANHPLFGEGSDYFVFGTKAWLSSSKSRAVARTTNGGISWALPSGTTTNYDWQLKQSSQPVIVRGNTFATTIQNRDLVWCVMGPYVYKSRDRGDTWAVIDTIPNMNKTNSFYVSQKDTNVWVAAVGVADRIMRTVNGGANWMTILSRDFSEYGMPLEMHPDKPDTLFFAPEDGRIYRSKDFGANWDTLSMPGFRSPCDLVIVPEDNSKVLVGDGVTGSDSGRVWVSTNGGLNFQQKFVSESSETPCLWGNRLENNVLFVTNWSSGGVWRTLDYGQTWAPASVVSSAWGGATAPDDPRAVGFNRYAGTPNYISTDQGQTFVASNLSSPGSGYALTSIDRSTWLDLHSSGIYKVNITQTPAVASVQALDLIAPNGGESWPVGSSRAITWTASNVGLVHIEYRTGPAQPWLPVADVEGHLGTYSWTVPNDPTIQAQVRVTDAWDGVPSDVSSANFTIGDNTPQIVIVAPAPGSLWQYATTKDVQWQSLGVSQVAVEYRIGDVGPWQTIIDPIDAGDGATPWIVPNAPTTQARVRVRELPSGLVAVSEFFSIVVPSFTAAPSPFELGSVPVGYAHWDTLRLSNPGTGVLTISNITSNNPNFWTTRTALVVQAGKSDTIGIYFKPIAVGPDQATITFTADDPGTPHVLIAQGSGNEAVDVEDIPVAFALDPGRPNPFREQTTFRFALPVAARARLEVFNLQGRRVTTLLDAERSAGYHSVVFRPADLSQSGRSAPAPGVYFVRFAAGGFERTYKLLYLAR